MGARGRAAGAFPGAAESGVRRRPGPRSRGASARSGRRGLGRGRGRTGEARPVGVASATPRTALRVLCPLLDGLTADSCARGLPVLPAVQAGPGPSRGAAPPLPPAFRPPPERESADLIVNGVVGVCGGDGAVCLESLAMLLSGHGQNPYMGQCGGAPTAAGWGEDCSTGPPISSPPGYDPSHCSDTPT